MNNQIKAPAFDWRTWMPQFGLTTFDGKRYFEDVVMQWINHMMKPDGSMPSDYVSNPLPVNAVLPSLGKDLPSFISFDVSVPLPVLMNEGKGVWMGLSPMEMITQREGIEAASGTCMIAGCGLGWFTMQVLLKPEVDYVVLVDNDPDTLKEFGEPLQEKFPGKLKLFCGDAYEYGINHAGIYDCQLWDIWMGWGEAEHDERFTSIESACAENGCDTVWGWGRDIAELDRLLSEMYMPM